MRVPTLDLSIKKYTESWLIKAENLFRLRICLSVWVFTVMILTYVDSATPKYLFTFTYLSYNGIFLYLMSALYISFMSKNEKYNTEVPLVAGWVNSVLYQCSYCFHLIVPIVYWSLLATDFGTYDNFTKAVSILVHGFDFFIMTIEFIFNRQQPTYATVVLYMIITVFYMFWAWIYYGFAHVWVVFYY